MAYVGRQAFDSTGQHALDLDSLPHAYTYDGSGNLTSETVMKGTVAFVKTYTWSGTNLMSETAWVKQ
jgi:YD repeat-containing protein